MPAVPKKRQTLTAAASKSWKTDHTSHQASEALEKGGVYASIEIGSGPIWEISVKSDVKRSHQAQEGTVVWQHCSK